MKFRRLPLAGSWVAAGAAAALLAHWRFGARVIAETEVALAKHPASFPFLVATSSETGAGIADLRAAIALLADERNV